MPDLSRDFIIAIYGDRPSFDPASGPMRALVKVDAGVDPVLVDRERERCRIERTPTCRDLDKWCSPTGLILAARRGEWGVSMVEDHYLGDAPVPATFERSASRPIVGGRASREPLPSFGRYRRAAVPRDLCSCLRCRDLVIVRRSRWGGSPIGLAAPGRLYRRATAMLPWRSACQGPGASAVDHGVDCASYRLGESGPIRPGRRARAALLAGLIRMLRKDPVGSRWLEPRAAVSAGKRGGS